MIYVTDTQRAQRDANLVRFASLRQADPRTLDDSALREVWTDAQIGLQMADNPTEDMVPRFEILEAEKRRREAIRDNELRVKREAAIRIAREDLAADPAVLVIAARRMDRVGALEVERLLAAYSPDEEAQRLARWAFTVSFYSPTRTVFAEEYRRLACLVEDFISRKEIPCPSTRQRKQP